jgi:hypothetical protein
MMYGHEKSDPAILVMKPTNKAGKPAADSAERRAGAEGSADDLATVVDGGGEARGGTRRMVLTFSPSMLMLAAPR